MFDFSSPLLGAPAEPGERPGPHVPAQWFSRMLDEVDYSMLLVADDGAVLHANHAARLELDESHPLQLLGQQLRAQRPQDLAPLREALQAANARGLRRLVLLGEAQRRVALAVVPLAGQPGEPALALLVLGKRSVCQGLSTHWFARTHGLTPAEARVLDLLCEGCTPVQIASQQGVAISTVRTQLGALRAKTGAPDLRALVRQVAVLPPLVGRLRGSANPAAA